MDTAITDPCGIVETIQSNMTFRSIAYEQAESKSSTPSEVEGEASDSTEKKERASSSSPSAPDEESTEKDRKDIASERDDTENDSDPSNDTNVDTSESNDDIDNDNDNDNDNNRNSNSNDETRESTKSKLKRKFQKSGILRGWGYSREEKKSEEVSESSGETSGPPKTAAVSDLSDPTRKIYVVTTASLPWRTGTAVNPLARALYLTRGRPKNAVTLMIPWLESLEEQAKLYGSNVFETPEDQEAWIRKYSRERILTDKTDRTDKYDEVDKLRICFYPAKYHTLLGSIFATVDICALIPHEEADVAILEEPEHLTWFRSLPPSTSKHSKGTGGSYETTGASAMSTLMDHDQTCGACSATGSDVEKQQQQQEQQQQEQQQQKEQQQQQQQAKEEPPKSARNGGENNDDGECGPTDNKTNNGTDEYEDDEDDHRKMEELAIIGWTAKFNYVVGILHTNYSAYMRQYGLGASIVTASALQALSTVCVRAYTHRLIRLSDTLPELDRSKEITCNVHGVRPEFFADETASASASAGASANARVDDEPATNGSVAAAASIESVEATNSLVDEDGWAPTPEAAEETSESSPTLGRDTSGKEGHTIHDDDDDDDDDVEIDEQFRPEPIYFIGKVIWAKGFDKLLDIEDLYRKETGEYFPIDVYGSGGDFDAIARAFLGRSGLAKKISSSGSIVSLEGARTSREASKSPVNEGNGNVPPSPQDQTAALLFSREGNLRGMIEEGQTIPSNELVVEVQTHEIPAAAQNSTPTNGNGNGNGTDIPRDVMTHLGVKTAETTSSVTKAIATLSGKLSNLGFRTLYREESDDEDGSDGGTSAGGSIASKFRFDPPKSRYELRRHSIPARFLGVKDHAVLRDVVGHKIFINLSITEVLCTTTAEAMAMGKFVIIPNHPSNTFFLQFPNCLAYESKKECVDHIKHALSNDPTPLSPEDRHKLTWEGANVRLFESSRITEEEAEERNKKTGVFAKLHIDTMKTGAFFQGLWARGTQKYKKERRDEREEDEKDEANDNADKNPIGFCKISKPPMLDCM